MLERKNWFLIVAVLIGVAAGFVIRPAVSPGKAEWRVIKADEGFNNVYYPAYLLNERTGRVILIGSAANDKNNDGKNDTWNTYNEVLYEGGAQ